MNMLFSIEWKSITLSGPDHRIVTKTVHKSIQGGCRHRSVGGLGGGNGVEHRGSQWIGGCAGTG